MALSDHPIRLRFSIEGVGITIRTKPNYIPPAPHTLGGGGAPILFYGEDLIDYFSPENLDFAGFSRSDFQKSAKLPEGVYRFSFEVFDYHRQVPLSNKITMVTWIVLNDPPLLNLPLNQAKVSLIDPTNIVFTWTPRHTASPNAAFSTEYVFKIVEIWPIDRNPYDAFLAQNPLYETTTTESQIIYGPAEPALIAGRKYAWQVQARDQDHRDIFKNQGKSEVFLFQFGGGLGIPENLHKQSGNTQTLTLLWDPPLRGGVDQYNIRYKTPAENKWNETLSDQPWVTLTGLQPNTNYEVQVRSKREDLYSDYTPALQLKTDEKTTEFACGQPPPKVNTDKSSRLLQLTPGDLFTCNDWRIVVVEVTRSEGGEYAGKGMMAVKMFNGASVEVAFQGAINANYQLITGEVESTYQKDSKMGLVVEEMHKIGENKKSTPEASTDSLSLPQLQELAQTLIDIPQKKIDNATVLNQEEKQQINGARTKAKEALKTLNDSKATAKDKKEAGKNLRQAVADAKPAMDKLTNSPGKDKQTPADRWFKNIMDFLNAYKGDETGKKQAIVWHHRMDSVVNVLSQKTGVPKDLMQAMTDAHQNAQPAWTNLEKGTDGIRPQGPSADFEEGYTPEDIALCKKEVEAAEAVAKYTNSRMLEFLKTLKANNEKYINTPDPGTGAYLTKNIVTDQDLKDQKVIDFMSNHTIYKFFKPDDVIINLFLSQIKSNKDNSWAKLIEEKVDPTPYDENPILLAKEMKVEVEPDMIFTLSMNGYSLGNKSITMYAYETSEDNGVKLTFFNGLTAKSGKPNKGDKKNVINIRKAFDITIHSKNAEAFKNYIKLRGTIRITEEKPGSEEIIIDVVRKRSNRYITVSELSIRGTNIKGAALELGKGTDAESKAECTMIRSDCYECKRIPPGEFPFVVNSSGQQGQHKYKTLRLLNTKVNGSQRDGILIHMGDALSWTEGCLLAMYDNEIEEIIKDDSKILPNIMGYQAVIDVPNAGRSFILSMIEFIEEKEKRVGKSLTKKVMIRNDLNEQTLNVSTNDFDLMRKINRYYYDQSLYNKAVAQFELFVIGLQKNAIQNKLLARLGDYTNKLIPTLTKENYKKSEVKTLYEKAWTDLYKKDAETITLGSLQNEAITKVNTNTFRRMLRTNFEAFIFEKEILAELFDGELTTLFNINVIKSPKTKTKDLVFEKFITKNYTKGMYDKTLADTKSELIAAEIAKVEKAIEK